MFASTTWAESSYAWKRMEFILINSDKQFQNREFKIYYE